MKVSSTTIFNQPTCNNVMFMIFDDVKSKDCFLLIRKNSSNRRETR